MKIGIGMPIPNLSNLPGVSRPGGGGTPVPPPPPPPPPFPNTKSLLLNGSSSIATTNQSGWGASFTWSAWVKLTTSSGYSAIYYPAQAQAPIYSFTPYFMFSEISGTTNLVYGYNNSSGNVTEYKSNTTINTGSWIHVLLRKSSGALSLFINGQLDNAPAATDPGSYPSGAATIGNLPSFIGTGLGVNGNIDELSLFNYALSDPQIDSIWNNGTPADVSSLNPINWWRFENNGNDSGSGGNTATLNSTASYSPLTPP